MPPVIVGVSGSPVKNSNTDRLVKAVLESSELKSSFYKLSDLNVRPCRGCLKCAGDNICKVEDDFQKIAADMKNSSALVLGGYPPYGSLDAFSKAFLERLFSMRHRKALNTGKLAVTVVTGNARGSNGIDEASKQMKHALSHEGMNIIGQLKAVGNVKCTSCGFLESCKMSAFPRLFDSDITKVPETYCRVEDQNETWNQAIELGQKISATLNSSI